MIYTVFSTTDSPYMQWQSELLEYSWKKVGQPGELIRLVATDTPEALPTHQYARCVATRPWGQHPQTGDDFAPYNKPASLLEWIYRERPYGTLLLLDPDCVFRQSVETEVVPGKPIGQHWVDFEMDSGPPFGLGERFDGVRRYCLEHDLQADPVMIPNLIHSSDMQRIALRWLELTGAVRQHVRDHLGDPMWESDMFGFVMASAEYGLKHQLGSLGICTNWKPEDVPNAPIIHYCQPILDREGHQLWGKGVYRPWERVVYASLAAEDYGRDLLELINSFRLQLDQGRRPRQKEGVISRSREGTMELISADESSVYTLNTSADAIWTLCNGERTLDEVAEILAREFDLPVSEILEDVRSGVLELERAGFLSA